MKALIDWLGVGLTIALLVGAIVLPYVGGYPLAYALVLVALSLAVGLIATRTAPRFDPGALMFLAAFLLMALAFALTAESSRDYTYIANFAMFALVGPLSTALRRFADPRNALVVANLALIGSALAFAIAVYQSWELLMPRATGLNSDPIWAAQAALGLGFLALLGVTAKHWWRHLYALGPVLGTLTAFLGQSRGPLMAVPALIVIGIVFSFRRWWLALPVAFAVATLIILAAGTLSPSSLTRIETLRQIAHEVMVGETIAETSTNQRVAFYQSSWQAFLESPWVGHGWERKLDAIRPHLADHGAMLAEGHHHLHSDIADFSVSAGLLGVIAYILVIAAPIVGAWSSPRDALFRARMLGTILLSTTYFICGLTYLMLGYEFHTTLYVVLTAILLGFCRERPGHRASWFDRSARS